MPVFETSREIVQSMKLKKKNLSYIEESVNSKKKKVPNKRMMHK